MRGDIVIVDFEQLKPAAKVRPALVVQSDEFNQLLTDTVVAQITGNISRAFERTQLLINENHPGPARTLRCPGGLGKVAPWVYSV